jgi:hypothetical protein
LMPMWPVNEWMPCLITSKGVSLPCHTFLKENQSSL